MYLVASPDKTQPPDITSTITRKPEWTEEAVELFKGLTGDDKPLRGIMVPWNSTTYQLVCQSCFEQKISCWSKFTKRFHFVALTFWALCSAHCFCILFVSSFAFQFFYLNVPFFHSFPSSLSIWLYNKSFVCPFCSFSHWFPIRSTTLQQFVRPWTSLTSVQHSFFNYMIQLAMKTLISHK